MGDLRLNKPIHNVWMHGFGGRYNSFSNAKFDGFRMNYQGLQLGADTRLLVDSPVYLGAFVGYTHGNPKLTDGSAKAKSYHGGVYITYIDEDLGFYVDGVMKLSHYKKEFSVLDTARQNVSGKSSSNALSVSLETGKRFHFNEPKNGWYLEPQLQYTYTRKDSTDFTAINGLSIHIDAYNSNLGRLSGVVGYEFSENKTEYNAYWKTGIVREFSGRGHYRLNGLTEDHYFRGNWWNNALGLNARINQQHDFYVELSSDHGNKFNRYHINGGYRFIF